jgi:hypothetical protein
VLTELVRHYFQCPAEVTASTVGDLNGSQLSVVAEVDGFVRIQNTRFSGRDKVLVARRTGILSRRRTPSWPGGWSTTMRRGSAMA